FTVIISTIGGLQLFTEPYLFEPLRSGSTGGSARQYQTVVMYLYEKSFGSSQFKLGYASAIGWALFMLIAVISLVNFLIVRRIRSADCWSRRRTGSRSQSRTAGASSAGASRRPGQGRTSS